VARNPRTDHTSQSFPGPERRRGGGSRDDDTDDDRAKEREPKRASGARAETETFCDGERRGRDKECTVGDGRSHGPWPVDDEGNDWSSKVAAADEDDDDDDDPLIPLSDRFRRVRAGCEMRERDE
jgi:hypothetical protein